MVDAAMTVSPQSALEREHPGWRLWSSQAGVMWCATRRRDLSARELWQGLDQSLVCGSLEELGLALMEQDARERAYGRRF
ncbi:hypothetical protein [Actinomadura rupiterrae]|uniref:hypothetical protein n=1 Tax=Actinomadura rupiterrae TaxID=559627 RepID=UPI0020A24ABD|nr:hypothetical protein [Actinomadura rupiterrae]MCP2337523.1 hypothetical protein [Actinomadura rupiterrae]